MSKTKIIILAVVVGLLIFFGYRWQSSENTPDTVKPPVAPEQDKKNIPPPPPPQTSAVPAKDVSASAGFLPTQMEDPQRFEMFQKHLKEMSQCLHVKMNSLDPQSELSFDTFSSAISPELGDIVTKEMAWAVTDIRTKTGEVRRIHIERNFDADEGAPRLLKYYSVEADGSQKEIPLPKEQTTNPTDTLVASLEADGDLIGNSSAQLVYYKNGDDMMFVERNGKIYSFEVPHEGKTYSCTGADSSETMKCACK